MKTNYISSLLMVFLLFICSCKKELVPQESSGGSIPVATQNTPATPALNPEIGVTSTQNVPATQQNASALAGMNPPHGQAGHRCDIAVGAPLNSPPNNVKSTSAPVVTNSVSNSNVPAVLKSNENPVVTKPGMNPPHGQAGHRCDIAVGAPLNSPPTKAVPTPTPAATNSEPNNTPVPAILNPDTTAVPKS